MSGQTEPAFDNKLGQLLLGRYRIVRKLGEGGMGAVYEGKHELINKRLAIKCLHPQYMSNKEVVERFYREANAATAVGNEHIIEVSDVGAFDDGSPFMVMEFLEGIEFGRYIEQEGSLPIGRLVHIVSQVCSALAAAHERGIVHRDMKPENIYLVPRERDPHFVKVLDFGISKMREQNEALGGSLTKTGMALGTPYYMPPEQAQGVRDIDHRADVYAVGVILYQGLTGRLPFDAESYPALMVKILTEPPAPPTVFRKDVPDELEAVVMRAMEKDRNRRYQNMNELAEALLPFAGMEGAPVMLATLRPPPGSETTPFTWTQQKGESGRPARGASTVPPKKTGVLIMGAGLGLALVAAIVLVLRGGERTTAPVPSDAPPAPMPAPALVPVPSPQPVAQPMVAPALPAALQPKPTEVQVKISAQPSDARIFIGDVEFPNPMDAWRPRSLDPVRLRVEAPGHRSVEQLAIFDQDRAITFELEKGKGVKRLETLGAEKPNAPAPRPVAETPSAIVKPIAAPQAPAPAPDKPKPDEDGVYRGPSGTLRDNF
jgi:eukaryotic-like serine/threonine-protein kinase